MAKLIFKEILMKTLVCHCEQCRFVRQHTPKRNRIQTYQVRAARHRVKELLKTLPYDLIDDMLPTKISVDYYG